MRMTKQHFALIAKVLSDTRVDLAAYRSVQLRELTANETIDHIVSNFTTALYATNSGFNPYTFREACK